MPTIAEALAVALQHHQAGRFPEAEALYRQILEAEPNHAEALHLVGLLAHHMGQHETAVRYIQRAIACNAQVAEFHSNLGEAYRALGRLDSAVARYQKALKLRPGFAEAHNNLGLALWQQGKVEEAVTQYQKALERRPGFAEAFNNLGVALQAQGQLEEAVACYRQVVMLRMRDAGAYNNLGTALQAQGELEEAVIHYRQALTLKPDFAAASNNLGAALQAQGHLDEAVMHYCQALTSEPGYAEAHLNLGTALKDQGKLAEAVACHQKALALRPGYAEAHLNLGTALKDQGKLAEAVACYQKALALRPGYAEAHLNLGTALKDQGKLAEADACYQKALALKPALAEAYNNLALVLQAQGSLMEAVGHYRKALALRPTYAEALNNLGTAMIELGEPEEATIYYQKALTLRPTLAGAYKNLAVALQDQGRLDEAVTQNRQALALAPDLAEAENQLMHQLQHRCEWHELDVLFERQKDRVCKQPSAQIPPFTLLAIPSSPAEQLQCARNWVANCLAPVARLRDGLRFDFHRQAKPGLRLGYLSADLRQHPVARLIAEVFELHDRAAFEVFAYSYGPDDGSAIRQRLAGACHRFVDLRRDSFTEAARRIYEDRIDILVDLTGYTRSSRMQIAALRPAPIQVNFLGYPGTLGADFMDYLITDRFITPPEQAPFFAEKFVYLPDCYQANDRRRTIPDRTPPRAECGLPTHAVVFCCFNNTYKITPAVFDVWMRVLSSLPGSVLWLLEANRSATNNLRHAAQRRGVAPERLVFAPRVAHEDHLARLRLADLFLDTLPVNAHATCSDALWAGLPVLTCAGESFVSRVAGSLLTAIGLPELITYSLEAYEARALQLAHHPQELAALRERLAQNRLSAPLFDTPRFTRHLEAAYRLMWERHLIGAPPGHIEVPALDRR
jgi:predicted O-linked N-acetylglucosamine transferase (SPINDLY family)